MLMIPFLNSCSAFYYSKDDPKILLYKTFFGFTGLHALRRASYYTALNEKSTKLFTIDRYFLTKGFVPQVYLISEVSPKNPELSELITIFVEGSNQKIVMPNDYGKGTGLITREEFEREKNDTKTD